MIHVGINLVVLCFTIAFLIVTFLPTGRLYDGLSWVKSWLWQSEEPEIEYPYKVSYFTPEWTPCIATGGREDFWTRPLVLDPRSGRFVWASEHDCDHLKGSFTLHTVPETSISTLFLTALTLGLCLRRRPSP